ncbi:MAG: hypothetical protein HY961_00650 [Ignavibacteriae bacterium]|nr:hypothetical protein [Ignavibacteriota bacterium]
MRLRNWMLRVCFVVFATGFVATTVSGQGFPPAQGPPLPPTPFNELSTSVLINSMKTTIQITIDTVNAQILRNADSTGIRAHLSFTSKTFKPSLTTSTFPNRPNQNIVRIAFMVTYNVTGIRYHGVPYFSRKLGQSIELSVSCNNWFTNSGLLAVTGRSDRPFLEGSSFAEEALNFFIGHTLTDLVDSKLRARLPNGSTTFTQIPTSPCNCLGVTSGTAPNFDNGSVNFKKTAMLSSVATALGGEVTIQSIKRLKARPLSSGPLYKEVEDIQLEVYVNQTIRSVQLTGMREGDERNISVQKVDVQRPGVNGMIVLIANVEQMPLFQTTDTRFAVFKRNVRFGNGTQKLVVPKTYTEPPRRLPGGGMTKPTIRQVDAYEVTVLIKVPEPVIKRAVTISR